MAIKSILLITILVALVATQPQAQLGGTVSQILGMVPCSINGTVDLGGAPIMPFPNANVQLSCGGNAIASTTTNQSGRFNISVSSLQATLNQLLSSCALRVPTPLSTCNATLPSTGSLLSILKVDHTQNVSPITGANTTILAPFGFVSKGRLF